MKRTGVLIVALVAFLSTGCTSTTATPVDPTPGPAPVVAQPLSGVGSADGTVTVPLQVPKDAQSATVEFGCAGRGQFFSVELGDTMAHGGAPLVGLCDGVRRLTAAVDPAITPALRVLVPDGVRWVATVSFSTDTFQSNAAIAKDCADYSPLFSTLSNADVGFSHYDAIDEPTWRANVRGAADALIDIGARSETLLASLFTDFGAALNDPELVVGDSLENTNDISYLIARICDANQSPIVITGGYGG